MIGQWLGGGVAGTELQIFDTWEVDLMPCLTAEIDDTDVTVELTQDVDATLEPDLEVEEE